MNVQEIRNTFKEKYKSKDFVIDKSGVKTLEIINASFESDETHIFGTPSIQYAKNEHQWYLSQSLSIYDLKDTPTIWKNIASKEGKINSNYGWCCFSHENSLQYLNCCLELTEYIDSRRAVMIYSRPSIQFDAFENGMSDFICTMYTHCFIRNDELIYIVYQRSCDAVFGYAYDNQWHRYVQEKMLSDLQSTYPTLQKGPIHFNVGSLHIYQRHFKYLEN